MPGGDPLAKSTYDANFTRRVGNLPRNYNRGPSYFSLDVRLSKEFKLGKTTALEPIVEVFNVFNSANILVPQNTNLIFNFDGTIRAGLGDPRQVQVGARFIW